MNGCLCSVMNIFWKIKWKDREIFTPPSWIVAELITFQQKHPIQTYMQTDISFYGVASLLKSKDERKSSIHRCLPEGSERTMGKTGLPN